MFANSDKPVPCPAPVPGTKGCRSKSARVSRLYAPHAIYRGGGFTLDAATKDSENTKKYGSTR